MAPKIPANMTGGVDLTGSVDLDGDASNDPDFVRMNKAPDVIQTMTGGHGSLAANVNMPADDEEPKFHESEQIDHGLHKVATRYDGQAVRIRPASRFRTQRLLIAPGTQIQVAQRDSRRTKLRLTVTSATATDVLYVGTDLTTAATMGAVIPLGVVYDLNHGDEVGIATPATNNALGVTLSILQEIQE
jgi:hypothetical protein